MTKRCKYCGQFFVPDPRALKTQKACARDECRKARKREAQKSWRQDNIEYRKNHYRDYIIPYRQKKRAEPISSAKAGGKDRTVEVIKDECPKVIKDKMPTPMIKDGMPPSNRLLELVLLIPADTVGMIKDEIRLRKIDTHRFAAYG